MINTDNLNLDKSTSKNIIRIDININSKEFKDLLCLSKLNLEMKVKESLQTDSEEERDANERTVILFYVRLEEINEINKIILSGIKSMIDVYSLKNIYTKKDVITIVTEGEVPTSLIVQVTEFLSLPGISIALHSCIINFKNLPLKNTEYQLGYSLVTGGTRGIGASASQKMARDGKNLILTGRKGNEKGKEFAKQLGEEFGIKAIFHELDLDSEESIRYLAEFMIKEKLILETVVHNAAVGTYTTIEQTPEGQDPNETMIKVNSIGPLLLQQELEKMNLLKEGCNVIIISSVGGVRPFKEFNPVDIASKAILDPWAENLHKKGNRKVVVIYPGATDTDMFRKSTLNNIEKSGKLQQFINALPKQTISKPEHIGEIINFFTRRDIVPFVDFSKIQASCGLVIEFKDLAQFEEEKRLSLPEAHFICKKDPYNKITNSKGKICFGASQNYILSQYMLKYLPDFFNVNDLHYSLIQGSEEFRKFICAESPYCFEETLPSMNLECCLDMLCLHKTINLIGKAEIENIINHSRAKLVSESKNAEINIFFYPIKEELIKIIESAQKLTVIVVNETREIIRSNDPKIIYVHSHIFNNNMNCGVIQTTNKELLSKLISNYAVRHKFSNVVEAAVLRNAKIDISSELNLEESIVKMICVNEAISVNSANVMLTKMTRDGVALVMESVFEKGDKICISAPFYFGFRNELVRGENELVIIPDVEGLSLYKKVLRAKEDGAKGFLICNPDNPKSDIYEKDEICKICEWGKQNKDFYIIIDEISAYSVYSEGKSFFSALHFIEELDNLIVVRGFAKDFALSGFGIGYTITTNKKILSDYSKWKRLFEPIPEVLQLVDTILVKSNNGAEIIAQNKYILAKAMKTAISALDNYGIKHNTPHACLSILIDLREILQTHPKVNEFIIWKKLFEKYGVNIAPGTAFSCKEPGFFRITPIVEEDLIVEGIKRLHQFLIANQY